MGDLLIRNLDDGLKRELQEQARESGRSLSEEAVVHLRRSLRTLNKDERNAGDWLRDLLGTERWTEEEIAAIDATRYEPERPPPSFDE